MNIKDEMYFSPEVKTQDLKTITDNDLLRAYKDRISKWYIVPAKELDKNKLGFSSGLIQFSLIDALAFYFIKKNRNVGDRFKAFLSKYFKFDTEISNIIYSNYRNGLVHQSRIKGNCYFSYNIGGVIFKEDNVIMINPKIMNEKLAEVIENLFLNEENNELKNEEIVVRLRADFVDSSDY